VVVKKKLKRRLILSKSPFPSVTVFLYAYTGCQPTSQTRNHEELVVVPWGPRCSSLPNNRREAEKGVPAERDSPSRCPAFFELLSGTMDSRAFKRSSASRILCCNSSNSRFWIIICCLLGGEKLGVSQPSIIYA
jgi:hypothetical protein